MHYYTYHTLNQQCKSQTTALSSNHKFLTDDIGSIYSYPKYHGIFTQSQTGLDTIAKKNNTCSAKEDKKAIWGNALWKYMHYAAMNYPQNPTQEQIQEMESWLCSLATTIPCKKCSKHYRSYIEESKPELSNICSNKDMLFKFLVDLHNKVNQRTDKPTMSYDDAYAMYEGDCENCNA